MAKNVLKAEYNIMPQFKKFYDENKDVIPGLSFEVDEESVVKLMTSDLDSHDFLDKVIKPVANDLILVVRHSDGWTIPNGDYGLLDSYIDYEYNDNYQFTINATGGFAYVYDCESYEDIDKISSSRANLEILDVLNLPNTLTSGKYLDTLREMHLGNTMVFEEDKIAKYKDMFDDASVEFILPEQSSVKPKTFKEEKMDQIKKIVKNAKDNSEKSVGKRMPGEN